MEFNQKNNNRGDVRNLIILAGALVGAPTRAPAGAPAPPPRRPRLITSVELVGRWVLDLGTVRYLISLAGDGGYRAQEIPRDPLGQVPTVWVGSWSVVYGDRLHITERPEGDDTPGPAIPWPLDLARRPAGGFEVKGRLGLSGVMQRVGEGQE